MLSAGFVTRPLDFADAERCAAIYNAVSADLGLVQRIQTESVLLDWNTPEFKLGASSIGVFEGDLLIAFALFWATGATPVRPRVDWDAHPRHRHPGLAPFLLRWAQDKCAEVFERCPPEARISLYCGAHKGYDFTENALQAAAFRLTRHYYDMEIDMIERPRTVDYPDAIHTRPYVHDEDLPTLVDVARDAFSDHYGHIAQPFAKDLALFRHWLDKDPHFDPALVILAVDSKSGLAVGCLLGLRQDFLDPNAGYIDTVGVRRAFRRRGLATAMLKQSLAMFWDRGTRTVRLDVDGDSLTNAVALYERAGMRVSRQHQVYEKVLRDGIELAKVTLE